MGHFFGELKVLHVGLSGSGRVNWKLMEDLHFHSNKYDNTITAEKGFVTDFVSVPRLPLSMFIAGALGHKAAVIHDWLYRNGIGTRKEADDIFYEALVTSGISKWRANFMWSGVRAGGSWSWCGGE